MLWTALVPWTVLCLAGLVGGDDYHDFIYWYPGKRKLASAYDYEYSGPKSEYLDLYTDDYPQPREDYMNQFDYGNTDGPRSRGALFNVNAKPAFDTYLTYTKLSLFNRNQEVQTIKASDWFQNFDTNKDLVIMVHGAANDDDFFYTIASALLLNGDYNVIGIDWRHFILKEKNIHDAEKNVEEATKIGHVVNSVLARALDTRNSVQLPRTIYIGHGMGCIPAVIQSITNGFVFDAVYGLNPRPYVGNRDYLTLTQIHGRLVQTLSTLQYPYSLSHRDYRPIYTKNFYYTGNKANLAYKILAEAIMYGNMTARFCSTEEDYLRGYCSRLPGVPIWHRQMSLSCGHPIGSYFFELPSPGLEPHCDGQTLTKGG